MRKLIITSGVMLLSLCLSFGLWADDKSDTFVHGIAFEVDGEQYNFGGPADAENGAQDVPGHSWVQRGEKKFLGKHFNTGPFGAEAWWSSDASDGALLYLVEGKIDRWSELNAAKYYAKGYTHYHHLVNVSTNMVHPDKVVWLKHVAVGDFTLDKGPHPELGHPVVPGVDFRFVPNWKMPYMPAMHMQ